MTVLFADVVGSSAMAAQLDPEDWAELMDTAFERFAGAIQRSGGTISQLLGDGLLTFFGAPAAHEDDPLRAARAGLELVEIARDYHVEVEERYGLDFAVRVGLNTGTVVTIPSEVGPASEYRAVGDAVNLAARLQDEARPMTVLASPATHRLVDPFVESTPRGPFVMKGWEEPVLGFEIIRLRPDVPPIRPVSSRASLVGRRHELDILTDLGRSTASGVGGIVFIVGDPGIGKSRLLEEWRARLREDAAGATWAVGHCLSHGQDSAYHLATDLVRSLLDLPPDAGASQLERALAELLGSGQEVDRVSGHLAQMLGLPAEGERAEWVTELDPQARQAGYVAAVRRILTAAGSRDPVIAVVEDLHWADAASTELLSRVLTVTAEAPVLLGFTSRPEPGTPGWRLVTAARQAAAGALAHLELERLPEEQSRRLASALLGVDAVPGDVAEAVERLAEGNPLFVEEIVRALHEGGAPGTAGAAIGMELPSGMAVPDTLQGLLAARIDALDVIERDALRAAAVIGRRFDPAVVGEVLRSSGSGLVIAPGGSDERAAELLRRSRLAGLIESDPMGGGSTYTFRHALIHEVAYSSLLRRERRRLHLAVAEVLERSLESGRADSAAILARHFLAAEDPRALPHLLRAASRAADTYANEEALANLDRCGPLVATRPEDERSPFMAEIQERRGDVLLRTGEYAEARAAYTSALAEIPASDPTGRARVHLGLARTWERPRRFSDARAALSEALRALEGAEVVRDRSWSHLWIETQLLRMRIAYYEAALETFAETARRARPVVDRDGTPSQRAWYANLLALLGQRRERFAPTDETFEHALAAVEAARGSGDPITTAEMTFGEGFCRLWRGELAEAEDALMRGLALTDEIGLAAVRAMCLAYLAVVHRRRGRIDEVRWYATELGREAVRQQTVDYAAAARAHLAWIAWHEGRFEDAARDAASARAEFEQISAKHPMMWLALWPQLAAALGSSAIADAVEHARMLLWIDEVFALPAPAVAHLRRGVEDEPDEAVEHLRLALRVAAEGGHL